MHRFRYVAACLLGTALVVTPVLVPAARAEEDTAPPAPALAAKSIAVPGPVTAVVAGTKAGEVWLASEALGLVRHEAVKGLTWKQATGLKGVNSIRLAPDGRRALLSTTTTLHAWDTASGKALWQTPLPKAADWSPDGKDVHVVLQDGSIATLARDTGKERARLRVADKRTVREAVLHGRSGLAILGVADS